MAEIYQLDDHNRGLDTNGLVAAAALANGGGFGGGMNNPLWMMFMYPFIMPFLSMYGGFGGLGGFGGGAGNLLGTGFLSNQLNNNSDKETILTLYLNEIYYGRYACGVEKAAEVYFGKHASELDLSEAAFIAGLPQAPNYYGNDPAAGARRQREVLRIAERETRDGRCITLGSGKNPRQYCPGRDAIELALEK